MTADKLAPPSDEMRALVERVAHYSSSTVSDGTRRTRAQEFRRFRQWCESRGLPFLPSEPIVVATYLVALADGQVEIRWHDRQGKPRSSKTPKKHSYLVHTYGAIIATHRDAGHDWPNANPVVAKVLHGIAMRKGTKQRKATPITIEDLKLVLSHMRERRFEELKIIRDRAMLTLCFFGAFRRGELVRLRVEDLLFRDEGLLVTLPKSKMDPTGKGVEVGILPQKDPAICPVHLLREWIAKGELKSGYLFCRIDRNGYMGNKHMTGEGFALLMKQYVEAVGFDPAQFSGHSLRAGFATSAAVAGKSLTNIMRQGRWKDHRVAQTYIRPATVFIDNATEGLGDDDER